VALSWGRAAWRGLDGDVLPPLSVCAYMMIQVLSMTWAPDIYRSSIYVSKQVLMLMGGYALFRHACPNDEHLRMIFGPASIALVIAVTAYLGGRVLYGPTDHGFFDSSFKYGTYIGMLGPLVGSFLLLKNNVGSNMFGGIVVIATTLSMPTMGALLAMTVGMAVAIGLVSSWSKRLKIFVAILLAGVALAGVWETSWISPLREDLLFADSDGVNLRQRYIEWQAEMNLVGQRTVMGTGAGCLNTYRSEFYYRLPKLNTLKAFHQNGWLQIASETGMLGLLCFCWMITSHAKMTLGRFGDGRSPGSLAAIPALAGLSGACVANIFSGVQSNGIMVIFILLLVLASSHGTGKQAKPCSESFRSASEGNHPCSEDM